MKQNHHRVLIVGAGLGGLCLANGLKRSGFRVAVFERDDTPQARGQGYRLTIDPEGSKALRASLPANLYALAVATSGVLGDRFTIYDQQRRILRVIPLPHAADADDTQVSKQMDRMTLRQILLGGLPGQVHFGKAFTRYERTGDVVTAFFADGSEETGALLVGADGVNSRVSRQLLPDAAITDTGMRAPACRRLGV